MQICFSQQDSQYTQYMYNPSIYNPAYSGSREVLSVFALNRTQWVGFDGAPVTNCFSVHLPLDYANLGVGFSALNDAIGPSTNNTFSVDLSYTISTSNKYKMAFGIKFTADFWTINFTKLTPYTPVDKLLTDNINNQFSSNLGVGLYFYSNQSYFGFSVPKLIETNFYDEIKSDLAKTKRHYHFIAGWVFEINNTIKIKPSTVLKYTAGAPFQIDLSTNLMYDNKFTFGTSYKINATVAGLAGFQINRNWFLGYSYEVDNSKLKHYNFGTHEFFLRYEFTKTYKKVYSPRFF